MNTSIQSLSEILLSTTSRFRALDDTTISKRPAPGKWSPKEIIGHLIDSGHSNLRRFIVGQYSPNEKILYAQDFWVQANNYQEMDRNDLLTLWKLINERIIVVLDNMPALNYQNTIDTGKTETSLKTLQWLAQDYVQHMMHHINQIFPGSYAVEYGN